LVVYTATATDLLNPITSEFEAKTGISVEVVTAGTGELLKRIESEQANPLGDVEWGGVVSVISPKQNLFEEYKSANESSVIDSCKNTEGMITRFSVLPNVLLVNKKLIGDIKIEGYEDLLNPKLKGKIAFADPAKASSSFQHVVNILYVMGNGNPDKGWDFVDKLCKNLDGKLLGSSAAVPKGVADGEYVVGLTHEEYALQYVKQGANVEIVYMKEGTTVAPDTVQIIKGAKNLDNAKKFVDFLTSKETQTLIANNLAKRSVRSDVPADSILKQIDQIKTLQVDQKTVLSNNQAWLDKFKDVYTSK
jgi:iron(III) transport system substrate-binding protein